MRTYTESVCIVAFAFFILFGSCTSKKGTSPVETGPFLMQEYFPFNEGDEWTWEISVEDTVKEPFFDGDINFGEPFTDLNNNGKWDAGEWFDDLSVNGKYDGPDDPWTPGIPFEDLNDDGEFDYPNGVWDNGESFVDLDGDGMCGKATQLTLGLRTQDCNSHLIHLSGGYLDTIYNDNPYWFVLFLWQDDFSNDTLGLRWHGHVDPTNWKDYLKEVRPITIAHASTRIGDTVSYEDTSVTIIYTWISTFEGVEDVAVPAGTFQDCLKFKMLASGWIGSMQKYNGTSYRWYAKNIGLVKSEGPGEGEYWILKSVSVGGKDYP